MKKTKLKCLKVTSVDLCPQGANPEAHIELFKSAGEPAVKQPERNNLLKNIGYLFGKLLGKTPDEIDQVIKDTNPLQDDTGGQGLQCINDDFWEFTYALQKSLNSIILDDSLDHGQRITMMAESISQFNDMISKAATKWVDGETVINKACGGRKERLKALQTNIAEALKNLDQGDGGKAERNTQFGKGVSEMKFEKSKMSPVELLALEELEKKYAVQEPAISSASAEQGGDPVPAEPAGTPAVEKNSTSNGQDVAKAMAEIEKLREEALLQKMTAVSQKYTPLGKKAEELAPILVTMHKAGEEAYNSYVTTLDDSLNLIEKTGLFSEAGSSRPGDIGESWGKVEAAASALMKSEPNLTYEQAIVKAGEMNPELISEYESNR